MRRSTKQRDTWVRRLTRPLREFIQVDLDMTRQALRRAHPSAEAFFCAPPLAFLWVLDRMERALAD